MSVSPRPGLSGGNDWTDDEAKALRALSLLCDKLRAEDPLMTVTNLQSLVEVALQEVDKRNSPLSVTDLAARIGTKQSNMSRILILLGKSEDGTVGRGRRAGLGLVETRTDPNNYRERNTRLSASGRKLVRAVVRTIMK